MQQRARSTSHAALMFLRATSKVLVRQHERMPPVMRAMNALFHAPAGLGVSFEDTPLLYADRLRMRKPGDAVGDACP